jgi:hypothetical protein
MTGPIGQRFENYFWFAHNPALSQQGSGEWEDATESYGFVAENRRRT